VYFGAAPASTAKRFPQQKPLPDSRYLADLHRVGDFILGMPTNDPYLKTLDQWRTHLWHIVTRPRSAPDGSQAPWLDPFPVDFVMVPKQDMYTSMARDGFPVRYPWWGWGQSYYHNEMEQDYGFGKLYELVLNNNPAPALLLNTNSVPEQATVMAHVYGHSDFMRHNINFEKTDRHMVETMKVHARMVQGYIDQGYPVEEFIDKVKAVDNLIDWAALEPPDINRHERPAKSAWREPNDPKARSTVSRMEVSQFPPRPDRDVLGFLVRYGRGMSDWQRHILQMIRDEQYYFTAQMKTQIMNEGWATFWHDKLMKDSWEVLEPEKPLESIHISTFHSMLEGIIAPSELKVNPYRLGSLIYRDIEKRANEEARKQGISFDEEGITPGLLKIRDVMRMHDDESFIRTFLTDELIAQEDLYTYLPARDSEEEDIIDSRDPDAVREIIATRWRKVLPGIDVVDSHFNNRGEWHLKHDTSWDFKVDWAKIALRHLSQMWGSAVHLDSVLTSDDDPEDWIPIRYSTRIDHLTVKDKSIYYVDPHVKVLELDPKNGRPMYAIDSNGNRLYEVDAQGERRGKTSW
jgi:stage V sporulation protein R